MESIKVVKIINNEPYRTILKKGEYKKNKNGQIILPKDYYKILNKRVKKMLIPGHVLNFKDLK